MAFGKRSAQSNAQFGPNTKVFFVSIKEKDLPQPFFEVKIKEDGKYVIVGPISEGIKYLGGTLVDIKNKTFKYEGKDIESVTSTFVDKVKDEAYLLTISQGFLGRNILNSLLALKTYEGIEIGLYTTKPKEGYDKGFNSASVRQNNVMIYGKFKNEELPKIIKVKVGKDTHSDSTEINAFFTAQVEEFAKVLRAAHPAGAATASNTVGADNTTELEQQAETALGEEEPTLPGGKKLPF